MFDSLIFTDAGGPLELGDIEVDYATCAVAPLGKAKERDSV